ncbi:RraA family protein [Ornithinimicrobium pekingense]|uniref:Putative 4-hydroxy-4-methyl-2-oxoglutarate aldolase n=1 Tax=Ornithinimicrobium pekingense TaxID=384677 RepID=A0ABQ2FC28_9MICO|nr:RraA family protein [Ornithinimicrobium pekingense]GGK79739.1 4-carboxy-4-hydroxy-2-oxoadipate aldolase [Ornithinimicrobium pekingense]
MTEPTATRLGTAVPTSTVLDVSGNDGYLGPTIVRRAGSRAVGRALTVRTGPGDNLALHRALARAQPGDVLVVSCPGPPVGLAGEVICTALHQLGAVGLVTNSGIRDEDELLALGFPVWSAAVTPLGTTKSDGGVVGGAVEIGGVHVATGDAIVADGDGVVRVRAGSWNHIYEASGRKVERETTWLASLRQGTPLAELTGLV